PRIVRPVALEVGVLRGVGLEHALCVGGEGLVAQAGVGGGEQGDRVVLVFALRIGFQQVPGALGGTDVGATAQVVQAHVDVVSRERVAQRDHPLARVGGVAAVRVAGGDGVEVVVALHRRGQVAAAGVQRP